MGSGYRLYLLVCMVLVVLCRLEALTVGSNVAVSRPALSAFSATNNSLFGFYSNEKGFSLADNTTTCSFDDFFPVSGTVDLNSGRLFLFQDFVFSNTSFLNSVGRVYGNQHSFSLPRQASTFAIPSQTSLSISAISSLSMGSQVTEGDWSLSTNYLAACSLRPGTGQRIQIYYFDGATLTATRSTNITVRAGTCLRWNPQSYYFAVGNVGGPNAELRVYKFVPSTGVITNPSTADNGGANQVAVAWHPTGNFLAGLQVVNNGEISVWPFNQTTGVLGTAVQLDLTPNVIGSIRALAWGPLGNNYVAAGFTANAAVGANELVIASYNTVTPALTSVASLDVTISVTALDWCPTGSYIAAGLVANTTALRMYQFTPPSTLSQVASVNFGIATTVVGVSWDPTGNYVTAGIVNGASSSIKIYYFNKTTLTFTQVASIGKGSNVSSIRFSRDGVYLMDTFGTTVEVARAISINQFFSNTTVVMNSDIVLNTDLHFIGDCKLSGNGHRLLLNASNIKLRPGATLLCEDLLMREAGSNGFVCMTDNGAITFRNSSVSLSSDFTFSNGAILFDQDCMITGSGQFIYSASRTSSLNSNSTLVIDRNITFSYAPRVAKQNLLNLPDASSILLLNGCTLVSTRTGLRLSQGTLVIDGNVTVSSQGRNSGEAITFDSTLGINLLSAAKAEMYGRIKSN